MSLLMLSSTCAIPPPSAAVRIWPYPLTKPNQDLKHVLQGIASNLKWSAVEMKRIAERLRQSGHDEDAQSVLKMCTVFHAGEDRAAGRPDSSMDTRERD